MNIALATVHSSWGDFDIDAHTGEVIKYRRFSETEDFGDFINPLITRFDLVEYRAYYPDEQHPASDYDILDLGFWYGLKNRYEPPVMEWRKECEYERTHCHSLAVPSSVAELINPTTEN
jgi:hypothetical protein